MHSTSKSHTRSIKLSTRHASHDSRSLSTLSTTLELDRHVTHYRHSITPSLITLTGPLLRTISYFTHHSQITTLEYTHTSVSTHLDSRLTLITQLLDITLHSRLSHYSQISLILTHSHHATTLIHHQSNYSISLYTVDYLTTHRYHSYSLISISLISNLSL